MKKVVQHYALQILCCKYIREEIVSVTQRFMDAKLFNVD